MDELLAGLRAAGEETRVQILYVLSHGEFNVSELTQILGQSQPRVSRHLKVMVEAGLITRHKEGNWVLFRLREDRPLARAIVSLIPHDDPEPTHGRARIEEVRQARAALAARYFRDNADRWESLRSLHVREEDVESAMHHCVGNTRVGLHLDLGTGTGSVLRTFAPLSAQAIGIDQSREMLAIARVNLDRAGIRHAQVRHGDLYALPLAQGTADLVTLHQVLHYLDDPARALTEAARVLKPGGRLLAVDFAPHAMDELRDVHAHRRLGIAAEDMARWTTRAGLEMRHHAILPPPGHLEGGLTVSLWLAARPESRAAKSNLSGVVEHIP